MSSAKTNARRAAVQALYQWQMTGQTLNLIEQYFLDEQFFLEHLDDQTIQKHYFSLIFHSVPQQIEALDALLSEFVDRAVDTIDPVERAILRCGVFELENSSDIPYKVIINEYINIAKELGADGSHRYINGILDKIAQKQRSDEFEQQRK
jgi:N utilization substance protein B